MKLLPSSLLLAVARGLTLARLAGNPLFFWLLIITAREGSQPDPSYDDSDRR